MEDKGYIRSTMDLMEVQDLQEKQLDCNSTQRTNHLKNLSAQYGNQFKPLIIVALLASSVQHNVARKGPEGRNAVSNS